MKLLSIVVLYFPNNEVEQNILSYSKDCDTVVLWDNTPNGSPTIPHIPNTIILDNHHQNMGLGYAYNQAIKIAKEHNYTHIMTMDQDSCFENFAGYRDWVERINHSGISSVAINKKEPSLEESTIINDSAQSGTIFPIEMIDEIGPFREDFFIGMVDAEMCLRAQEHNYRTIQYNKANLIHHIGSERSVSFMGHQTYVSDYTPLRHYYDSRNRILMWHEFPYDIGTAGKAKHFIGRLKVMTKILLFENSKCEKIKAILLGTWYGLINKPKPFYN